MHQRILRALWYLSNVRIGQDFQPLNVKAFINMTSNNITARVRDGAIPTMAIGCSMMIVTGQHSPYRKFFTPQFSTLRGSYSRKYMRDRRAQSANCPKWNPGDFRNYHLVAAFEDDRAPKMSPAIADESLGIFDKEDVVLTRKSRYIRR